MVPKPQYVLSSSVFSNFSIAISYRGQDVCPPRGFVSYFANEAHNSHLVGAAIHSSSPNEAHNVGSLPDVELVHGNDNVRTDKRVIWNVDEKVRLMSAWIQHSIDSTCVVDKGGGQY
jgi:hypothetical protein